MLLFKQVFKSFNCVRSYTTIYRRHLQLAMRRRCSQLQTTTLNSHSKHEEWDVLYKLAVMRKVRLISRIKIYQILLMGGICVPLYQSYKTNTISRNTLLLALSGCIGTIVLFSIFSIFSTKLIGQISINKSRNALRISRLSFLGTRIEDVHSIKRIKPWTDTSDVNDYSNIFQRLYIENDNKKDSLYFYSIKHGNIPVEKEELLYDILGIPT